MSFSPEITGSARLNSELVFWLSDNGHKVDVIAPHPFYPEWKKKAEYKGKGWFSELIGRIRICRCPIFIPKKVTTITRILAEVSFVLSSLVFFIKLLFVKYDVVISVCPPLQLGILSILFAKLKKTTSVFFIHDLQVDAAAELGMIKNRIAVRMLFGIERLILQNTDMVVSLSDGMKAKINNKNCQIKELYVLNLWTDTKAIKPLTKEESFKSEWGLTKDNFVVLYAGNIGEKQGLEVVIDAAEHLKDEENIKIIICGNGANAKALQSYALERSVRNVYFKNLVPHSEISHLLATADLHLIPQKRAAADLLLPSKFTDILASGGVAIIGCEQNTTLFDITVTNSVGFVVEPENSTALAKKIVELRNMDTSNISKNARVYAKLHLDKERNFTQFEEKLKQIIK
ncbi:MAG: colanic acid biosynthesis glycosyl transferase WcaI [Salibacteraceae bacterium]|jgi:colanic acid biosynthesis glycosyl transferase WcaI